MAWVKCKENRILNLNRITDIGVGQLYSSNDKLEWFIIFRDGDENQCPSHPYISKEECEKDFNYLIDALNRGLPYIDITNISQCFTNRNHIDTSYLFNKGFIEDQNTAIAFVAKYVSSNKQHIIVKCGVSNRSLCNWNVSVYDQYMNIIGSLDFKYVDEFESFLKLCNVDYGKNGN